MKPDDQKLKETISALEFASEKTHAKFSKNYAIFWASTAFAAAAVCAAIYSDKAAHSEYSKVIDSLGGHEQIAMECIKQSSDKELFKECLDRKYEPAEIASRPIRNTWMLASMALGSIGIGGFLVGCWRVRSVNEEHGQAVEQYNDGKPFRAKDRSSIRVIDGKTPEIK